MENRVDELIKKIMAEHPRLGAAAQARYYEEIHQHLAPLARELEIDNNKMRAALKRIAMYPHKRADELDYSECRKIAIAAILTPNAEVSGSADVN